MQLVIAIIPCAGHAGSQVGYFLRLYPARNLQGVYIFAVSVNISNSRNLSTVLNA